MRGSPSRRRNKSQTISDLVSRGWRRKRRVSAASFSSLQAHGWSCRSFSFITSQAAGALYRLEGAFAPRPAPRSFASCPVNVADRWAAVRPFPLRSRAGRLPRMMSLLSFLSDTMLVSHATAPRPGETAQRSLQAQSLWRTQRKLPRRRVLLSTLRSVRCHADLDSEIGGSDSRRQGRTVLFY